MCVCTHKHTHTHVYIYIYIHTHTYTHTHTQTGTNTHTHTQRQTETQRPSYSICLYANFLGPEFSGLLVSLLFGYFVVAQPWGLGPRTPRNSPNPRPWNPPNNTNNKYNNKTNNNHNNNRNNRKIKIIQHWASVLRVFRISDVLSGGRRSRNGSSKARGTGCRSSEL